MLSATKVNCILQCPFKYKLDYIDKLSRFPDTEAIRSGKRVHEAIACRTFSEAFSDVERAMQAIGQEVVENLPGAILETTYEDTENPGRIYGIVLDEPFVGIFDLHCLEPRYGADWKTGKFNPRYTGHLEVQAYILNALYQQKYGFPLDSFEFHFLRLGQKHIARCISNPQIVEPRIRSAIEIARGEVFECRPGPLCPWCSYQNEQCTSDNR